jgi:hypothetical protein
MAPEELEEKGYSVEVSGWDDGENFFVEKTTLCWCGDGSKKVLLQTPLHEGSLVFVRLNDNSASGRGVPVTYQIAKIGGESMKRGHEVELKQLHPRFGEQSMAGHGQMQAVVKQ